jgi:DMSO/TMAO reductase YedYZ molybdopterin-dependent catalytic subunit
MLSLAGAYRDLHMKVCVVKDPSVEGDIVEKRRQFLKKSLGIIGGFLLWTSPLFAVVRKAFAQIKKIILPKGTARETLIDKNPALLDASNLDPVPVESFGTMGLSDHEVDLKQWRLEVTGRVKNPLRLTFEEMKALPALERNVLLICPGFFANHGTWKGISVAELLRKAQADQGVTQVTVRGPEGKYTMVKDFKIEDIYSNRVFLAYEVNGKALPRKHGFPLRLVAEGYYGYDWVKYVHNVTVEKIQS